MDKKKFTELLQKIYDCHNEAWNYAVDDCYCNTLDAFWREEGWFRELVAALDIDLKLDDWNSDGWDEYVNSLYSQE